jgi:hypothetical protein
MRSTKSPRVLDWQHICSVWWACFSTDNRHTYGYKLCSSPRRLVPLFGWGRLHKKNEKKLARFEDISFIELLSRIRVVCSFLQNNICPFLAQGICIYVGHSFFMKHSWTNSINLSFSLEWAIVVQRVEKSNVLMLLQEERGLDCMYVYTLTNQFFRIYDGY